MPHESQPLLLGDALALARAHWVQTMKARLARRGYEDYRRSDPLALRILARGPRALNEVAIPLHVSRQAARKVVDTLERRGYVEISSDPTDGRRRLVHLSARGITYHDEVVAAMGDLNDAVRANVDPSTMRAALWVLEYVRRCVNP